VAFAARLLHQNPALAQAQPQADHQVALLQEDEVPRAAHRDQRVSQKDKIKQLLLLFLGRIFFFPDLAPEATRRRRLSQTRPPRRPSRLTASPRAAATATTSAAAPTMSLPQTPRATSRRARGRLTKIR
jgi:hypothetical protein